MIKLIEYNKEKYADARLIHKELGIKKDFSTWAKHNIKRALLDESDFYTFRGESSGGRPSIEYWLKKDAALAFCMVSGGKKAKLVRDKIIESFNKEQDGITLSIDQVTALTDMVKAMTLVSVQKKANTVHYEYLGRPHNWWKYRAELLGYSKNSLIDALRALGKKYKSQKQALIHIDPAEIIRTGVVDLLIALGRDKEYAINIGEWAKAIAKSNGYHFQIWDDTKPNPLGLKMPEIIERQKIGSKYLK